MFAMATAVMCAHIIIVTVTVGFTKSRFSAQPGKSVEIAVEIKSGDLQPNETARVECDSASKNNTGKVPICIAI